MSLGMTHRAELGVAARLQVEKRSYVESCDQDWMERWLQNCEDCGADCGVRRARLSPERKQNLKDRDARIPAVFLTVLQPGFGAVFGAALGAVFHTSLRPGLVPASMLGFDI